MPTITEKDFDPIGLVEMSPEGQKSTRFNNPYNIKIPQQSNWASEFGGTPAPDGKFLQFPTPEAGVHAATHLIQRDYANKTLAQAIETFAPTSENPNTPQRIMETAQMLGVNPNTPLTQIPLAMFMQSQVRYESPTKINPAIWGEAGAKPIQPLARQAESKAYQTNSFGGNIITPDQFDPIVPEQKLTTPAPMKTPPVLPIPADPMAESLGMFQPGPALQEAGKLATEYAPEIGFGAPLMAGGAASPQFSPVLTKGLSIARALPIAGSLAGMGYAAGNIAKEGLTGGNAGATMAESMGAPPAEGMPTSESLQMFQSPYAYDKFKTGAGYEAMGQGIMGFASKLFAPAAGKITAGAKSAMDWMQTKGLPYSADAIDNWVGTLSQKLADNGLGGFITNSARKKTVEGISQEATNLMESLGLKPLKEASSDLSQVLAGWGDMNMTYTEFNKALDALPANQTYSMYGLKDALMSLSKSNNELSLPAAEQVIKRIYKGNIGADIRETLINIMNNGWEATPAEIKVLSNDIRRGAGSYMRSKIKPALDKMKEGLMTDFNFMMTPGGPNVGRLREIADKAMTDAYNFLNEVGDRTGLVFRSEATKNKWTPTLKPENLEDGLLKLFREDSAPVLMGIKDNLIKTGNEGTWNAIKLAYLKNVFDNATPATGKLGERVFQPKKFLDWYKNNAEHISTIMPEHMANIDQWANISRLIGKDFERAGKTAPDLLTMSGLLGGAGYLSGSKSLTAVPLVFSPLAAIFTMYPSVNFLTKYASKGSIGPVGKFVTQAAHYAPMSIKAINERFNK